MQFFLALRTQWVQGFGGPVGLNYAVIEPTMGLMGLKFEDDDERQNFFLELQVLEDAALEAIYSKVK